MLQIILLGLTVMVFIVLIILLSLNMIKNNKGHKHEFIKDMNNLHGPLYDIIKNQKNYNKIVSYIYNNNKEQINCIYNNNSTKDEFLDLIDSNCLHDELMYKILLILDKNILNILTIKNKGPDLVKGVIIMFLSIVYLYQGLQEIKSHNYSESKPEDLSSLHKMCLILACNSSKQTILTIRNQPIKTNFLTNNNLYDKNGNILDKINKHKKLETIKQLILKTYHFIKVFSDGTTGVAVNHQYFNDFNSNTIMPVLNKIKLNLEQTVCEKDIDKSTYNAAYNLFNTINENLADILINEILNYNKLIPAFNPLVPVK